MTDRDTLQHFHPDYEPDDTLDEPAGAPTTAATFRAREREAEAFRLRESVEAGLRSCGYAAGDDGGTIEMTLSALQRFFEDERRRDLDLKLTLAALRHVTRAANDRDRAALATVEGHVQPVVDAFMGWVQARQGEERIAALEAEIARLTSERNAAIGLLRGWEAWDGTWWEEQLAATTRFLAEVGAREPPKGERP